MRLARVLTFADLHVGDRFCFVYRREAGDVPSSPVLTKYRADTYQTDDGRRYRTTYAAVVRRESD